MAKPKKGGLGRGLDSLLGNEIESAPAQSAPAAPQVVSIESEIEAAPKVEDLVKAEPDQSLEPKVEGNKFKEEDYSKIGEEKVTIKGVVEREVKHDAKPEEKPAKKEEASKQVVVRDSDEVPIEDIQPNPSQPRTNFNKDELEELAESIKRNGLLQPILVRKKNGKYEIIAGERRWQASKIAGLKKVPIRVRDVDDDETIALALIENIQRSDLNPIEEAYGYRRMMERGKMTQSQVAQAVSKGRSTVANALRLLELPEEAQQLLFEEQITAGHARAILSVPTKEGRDKLTEKLVKEQLSVRETEAIARLMSGKKKEPAEERPKTPKSYKTVARSLRDTLQADVRIKSVKGKNKIEIAFQDEADLERLFRIIVTEK